jgi:hypothetical protein
MTKKQLCSAVAAAFLASGACNLAAQGVDTEPNNTYAAAQRLAVGSDGSVQLVGALGNQAAGSTVIEDIDFFWFQGTAGNVVTIDIDGGMKATCPPLGSVRCLDSSLALFGPNGALEFVVHNVPATQVDRPGSVHAKDPFIGPITLPTTGRYTVAVASAGRNFNDGGAVSSFLQHEQANGSYTLIISGATVPVQQINISIKPGATHIAPLNPKSKGNIPVALRSSKDFNALDVDRKSITFGSTGHEESLVRCAKEGEDVDGDGLLDLVCHFDNQAAKWEADDEVGEIKGKTNGGVQFEGRGHLKIVPKRD